MQSSATKDVLRGPNSYTDYDRSWGNRRQLLIPDHAANILSNFLAVFLALAAKGLFTVLRRVLKVYFSKSPKHSVTATVSDEQELQLRRDLQAELPFYELQTLASTSVADALPSRPGNALLPGGRHATGGEADGLEASHAHPSEMLEIVEQAKDAEGLVMGSLGSLLEQLRRVVPLRRFGEEDARLRVFSARFWTSFIHLIGENSTDLGYSIFLVFFSSLFYIGSLLLGIMCTYPVVSDSVAVSRSPHCGIIMSPEANEADAPRYTIWKKYYHDIAVESQQYASTCYNAEDGADGCSFFYEQSIQYAAGHDDTCHFKDQSKTLCFNNSTTAYTLSTGVVDAKVIGINSPLRYTFQRSLTCSPLRMDVDHIRPLIKDNVLHFRYFYGGRSGEFNCSSDLPNCTFELPVYKSSGTTYNLFKTSTYSIANASWQPLFDVDQSNGETACLILISNFGISYPSERFDPIFTANKTWDGSWYYNTNWHAGVLGCVERTIVCVPNLSRCMSLRALGDLPDAGDEESAVRAMLYFSLVTSGLGHSLGYLGAQALDAQSKLAGDNSLPLAAEQWKAETQKFFETSLARIQITARNLARGNPEGNLAGQKDLMHPKWKGMCSRYKFRSVGYKNISVSRFLGEFLAGMLLIVLSRSGDDEDDELWVEKQIHRVRRSQTYEKMAAAGKEVSVVVLSAADSTLPFTGDIGRECWKRIGVLRRNISGLWRDG